jgi:uncharacterized protein YxjI
MYLIREKLIRLGDRVDITDESGTTVLSVDGQVFSLHNRLVIRDAAGTTVAEVRRRLAALRPTYQITVRGQRVAEVRTRSFSPFGTRYTVDGAGADQLDIVGDLLGHEFTIARDGHTLATVSKRWLSLHDTYGVQVEPGQDDLLILATVLALNLAEDQQRAQR